MAINYDVVWYWKGGREIGGWIGVTIFHGRMAREVAQDLRRAGYVAHEGRTTIGAPVGPPSDQQFKELGL